MIASVRHGHPTQASGATRTGSARPVLRRRRLQARPRSAASVAELAGQVGGQRAQPGRRVGRVGPRPTARPSRYAVTGAPGRSTWWATSWARSSTAGTGTWSGSRPSSAQAAVDPASSPSSRPTPPAGVRPRRCRSRTRAAGRHRRHGTSRRSARRATPARPQPRRPSAAPRVGGQPVEGRPQRRRPPHAAQRLPAPVGVDGRRAVLHRRRRRGQTQHLDRLAGEQGQVGGEQGASAYRRAAGPARPRRRRRGRRPAGPPGSDARPAGIGRPGRPGSGGRRRHRGEHPVRMDWPPTGRAGLSAPPIRRAAPPASTTAAYASIRSR